MPSAGLLALLDDITSLLDDVATMTKVATKKTAGVIGDDLALNANQLTGACPTRELPLIVAVAKGSLVNKAILIPAALLITALLPSLIKPLLMIGGGFLCFEGAEKVLHKLSPHKADTSSSPTVPLSEGERIKGAVLTDFILSAEILVIALGAAAGATLPVQALTLCAIGIGMTILVYGSVAIIVKADDVAVHLEQNKSESPAGSAIRLLGRLIISGSPKLMKLLSVAGTAAMFLVGGEILAHGIPAIEYGLGVGEHHLSSLAPFGSSIIGGIFKALAILLLGLAVGLLVVGFVTLAKRCRRPERDISTNPPKSSMNN